MSNLYDLPEEILVTAEGGLRIITLNRPEDLNASTSEMLFAYRKWESAHQSYCVIIYVPSVGLHSSGEAQRARANDLTNAWAIREGQVFEAFTHDGSPRLGHDHLMGAISALPRQAQRRSPAAGPDRKACVAQLRPQR